MSAEADIHPIRAPEQGTYIEGAIGQGSLFDETHGYHADGIEGGLPPLPEDWLDRAIPVRNENTNGALAWCLEVHDIAAAKYAAAREKDLCYTRDLWEFGMLDPDALDERIRTIRIEPPERREHVDVLVRGQQRLHDTGHRPQPRAPQPAAAEALAQRIPTPSTPRPQTPPRSGRGRNK